MNPKLTVYYISGKFLTDTNSKPTNTGLYTLYSLVLHQNYTSLISLFAYYNNHLEFYKLG